MKGLKIAGAMKSGPQLDRFGKGADAVLDKHERRKRDQELGLVPFAVKLHGDLIKQIQALAVAENKSLGDVTTEVLQRGLAKK